MKRVFFVGMMILGLMAAGQVSAQNKMAYVSIDEVVQLMPEYKKAMGIPRLVIYGVDYFQFTITSERRWMKRKIRSVKRKNSKRRKFVIPQLPRPVLRWLWQK